MDNINVRKIRKDLNMTQSQLANKIGVTTRTVQKWEAGDTIPSSMENLLKTILTNNVENRIQFDSIENDNSKINSDMIKALIDELDSYRNSSNKFQKQIDRLLVIIEKLSSK